MDRERCGNIQRGGRGWRERRERESWWWLCKTVFQLVSFSRFPFCTRFNVRKTITNIINEERARREWTTNENVSNTTLINILHSLNSRNIFEWRVRRILSREVLLLIWMDVITVTMLMMQNLISFNSCWSEICFWAKKFSVCSIFCCLFNIFSNHSHNQTVNIVVSNCCCHFQRFQLLFDVLMILTWQWNLKIVSWVLPPFGNKGRRLTLNRINGRRRKK